MALIWWTTRSHGTVHRWIYDLQLAPVRSNPDPLSSNRRRRDNLPPPAASARAAAQPLPYGGASPANFNPTHRALIPLPVVIYAMLGLPPKIGSGTYIRWPWESTGSRWSADPRRRPPMSWNHRPSGGESRQPRDAMRAAGSPAPLATRHAQKKSIATREYSHGGNGGPELWWCSRFSECEWFRKDSKTRGKAMPGLLMPPLPPRE
jgi:hypothetical protein